MQPFFNPFLCLSHQSYPNGSAPSIHQQNLPQNNPQPMGMMNPQFQVPLSNPNFPQLNGFMNAQSNCFNVPPQFNMGPQLGVPNMSNNPFLGQLSNLIQSGNQLNPPQLPGQFLQNLGNNVNMPQQMNRNMAMPNMQQFSLQDLGQLLPPSFFENNFQLGQTNSGSFKQNQQNLVQPMGRVNAVNSNPPTWPHQNQNLQPNGFNRPKAQSASSAPGVIAGSNENSYCHNKFPRNHKGEVPKRGFQKPQFHEMGSGKKNGFSKWNKGKGHQTKRAGKPNQFDSLKIDEEKKRSVAVLYTEKEIQQWREERRKNYPSKTNIEKKLKKKQLDRDGDEETKIRSQQLQEILAKQAELGVEVAEIPSDYLLDSKKLPYGREENKMKLDKKKRFRNKQNSRATFKNQHNKRRRYDKMDKFDKKQNFGNKDLSTVSSLRTRSPTLLQKLLSTDIKRDMYNLLQVFRFIVMNSFFKDGVEQSLMFPSVVVKENGGMGEILEEKTVLVKKDIPGVSSKGKDEELDDCNGDEDCEKDVDETVDEAEEHCSQAGLGESKEIVDEENRNHNEEGEIID